MLRWFLPKEHSFFDLFGELSDLMKQAAKEYEEFIKAPIPNQYRAHNITEIEHKADQITHKTMDRLRETFITPIDRDDIRELIDCLDDVIDLIDGSARRIVLYEVKEVPQELQQLSWVLSKSIEYMQLGIKGLFDLKKNSEDIRNACRETQRLENEADNVFRHALARMFKEEEDLRMVIKLKEVFELLERATDACEDVANVLEGILIEHT
jgi:uncharacterized protein